MRDLSERAIQPGHLNLISSEAAGTSSRWSMFAPGLASSIRAGGACGVGGHARPTGAREVSWPAFTPWSCGEKCACACVLKLSCQAQLRKTRWPRLPTTRAYPDRIGDRRLNLHVQLQCAHAWRMPTVPVNSRDQQSRRAGSEPESGHRPSPPFERCGELCNTPFFVRRLI